MEKWTHFTFSNCQRQPRQANSITARPDAIRTLLSSTVVQFTTSIRLPGLSDAWIKCSYQHNISNATPSTLSIELRARWNKWVMLWLSSLPNAKVCKARESKECGYSSLLTIHLHSYDFKTSSRGTCTRIAPSTWLDRLYKFHMWWCSRSETTRKCSHSRLDCTGRFTFTVYEIRSPLRVTRPLFTLRCFSYYFHINFEYCIASYFLSINYFEIAVTHMPLPRSGRSTAQIGRASCRERV